MGDSLYGKDRPVGGVSRLMLHAQSLEFRHPNGQIMTLKADPPPDFVNVLAMFQG
jgi:23S rRNA-/tRNA-specific pseudouridylate synthase